MENQTPDTIRISVRNVSRSPRGFHDASGRVRQFDPGKSGTATVTETVYARLVSRSTTWLIDTMEHGVMASAAAPLSDDVLLAMSNEDFAAYYESAMGKKPHHASKRETLIEKLRAA
jgi:hypothetical protein